MIGKYVIARCKNAGVHAGVLISHKGQTAELHQSRRLWYWKAAAEFTLSGVARNGLGEGSKIGGEVRIILTDVCELIEVSPDAEKSLRDYPIHEPKV